jgi:hypothetical protein
MSVEYGRSQRESIYHTATVGDIPFEVIQKSFRSLGSADLLSVSLSCRAWRQAAAELLVINIDFKNKQKIERVVCGMQLKSIVSGFSTDYLRVIAISVAPTLSSLSLKMGDYNEGMIPSDCYEVLEAVFSRCLRIRNLVL